MKSLRPLVSIIMPLHNSAEFVAFSIESVLAQSEKDWELILIDDVSSDNTVQVVKNYCSDDRVKLLKMSVNSGAAVARNRGLEEAKGRFVSFLDSDDIWLPNKLQSQIKFMKEKDVAFTFTDYQRIDEKGSLLGKPVISPSELTYERMLRSNQVGCLTAMYDSERLGYVSMPLLRKRQDYALWLKLIKRGGAALRVPEVLAHYRVRTGSISSNKIEMLKYNWLVFRKSERFGIIKSTYYLFLNVIHRVSRYQ